MKRIIFMSIFLILTLLNSINIPYSKSLLKSESNYLAGFVRILPADHLEVPLKTNAWLWHDKENLKLYFEAEINDTFSNGRLAKKDDWVDCDFIRIEIITDVKNDYAYIFTAFPLGNKYDGIRRSDLILHNEWNSNYTYENSITDTLWSSSMSIPLKDLRFYSEQPYNWKIILTRYLKKEDEYYSLPFGTIDMGKNYFRTAYDITINDIIEKKKNYRITPYFIKKYDLINEQESYDPENIGVDFSYNPTSSTKMKLSINPDFSDVPMDTVEDNFNVRYAPSYQENRFFFIEDLDIFEIGNQLFYSRHIMQPEFAIKLTGDSEHFSYGILSAMDKKIIEDNVFINDNDSYNALAIKPIWENFDMQLTLLNRMNKNYHNEVFALNPVWKFSSNHSVWSEVNLSYLQDDGNKKGYLFSAGYNGKKGCFNWSSTINNCSKNYTADMGLVHRTDFTEINANLNYYKDFNGSLFKSFGSNIWFHKAFEKSDNLLEQNGGFGFWNRFEQKFNIGGNINIGQENFQNEVYKWDSISIHFSFWKYPLLNININYDFNHSLIYPLNDIFKQNYLNVGLRGDISTTLSYNISAQHIRYFDFPINCGMDDKFWICNTDLTISFYNTLSLTNGLRLNDYESPYSTKYLGFFSNLKYEFKENCNFYIGYKTAQNEIEQKYIINYKQAYLKMSYTF